MSDDNDGGGNAFANLVSSGGDDDKPEAIPEVKVPEALIVAPVELKELDEPTAEIPSAGLAEPVERVWTCHPIQSFRYAGFQFEKATLRLTDPDKIARFESALANAAPRTKSTIREISREGADKIGRAFKSSTRVRGIDTSRPSPSGGAA